MQKADSSARTLEKGRFRKCACRYLCPAAFRQDALIEIGCSVPSLHSKGLFALLSEGELGRGNFEDLVRDTGLAGRVVFEGEVFDQILGVVRGALHRDHSSALF